MPTNITIDLITSDPATDEFVLYLIENGPWPPEASLDWKDCLARIQKRIFDAIDIAVDGHLRRDYPESSGKSIRVQIDSPNGLPGQLSFLIAKISQYIKEDNDYGSAIKRSPNISSVRVVTGHEMGRFK